MLPNGVWRDRLQPWGLSKFNEYVPDFGLRVMGRGLYRLVHGPVKIRPRRLICMHNRCILLHMSQSWQEQARQLKTSNWKELSPCQLPQASKGPDVVFSLAFPLTLCCRFLCSLVVSSSCLYMYTFSRQCRFNKALHENALLA